MKLNEYQHIRNAIHARVTVQNQDGQWFALHSVLYMMNMARKKDAITHLKGYHDGVVGMYPVNQVVAVGDRELTFFVRTKRYRKFVGCIGNEVLTPIGFVPLTKMGIGSPVLCSDFNKGIGKRFNPTILPLTSVLLNNEIPFERDGQYVITDKHKFVMTNIRGTEPVTVNGITTLGLSNYRQFLHDEYDTKDLCEDEIMNMYSYKNPSFNFSVGVSMEAEALVTRDGYILKATNEEI